MGGEVGGTRAAIVSVIGDAIGVDVADIATVPEGVLLEDLTIAGIEIDSLDMFVFVAELEYRFDCEVEMPATPGGPWGHTWGEFLAYLEGVTRQRRQED